MLNNTMPQPTMNFNMDHMYNMIFISLMTALVTSVVATITEMSKNFMSLIGQFFNAMYEYYNKIRKSNKNELIIEHRIKETDPKINNKIIISAIMYDFNGSKSYTIDNKEISNEIYNDYEKEKGRELIRSVNGKFTENDIEITYELVNKNVKKKPEDGIVNQNKDETVEVPYSEKIRLVSSKSIEHMNNYVIAKKNKYIDKFCSKDNKLYIYPVAAYGANFVEFNKLKFESQKSLDGWFSPHKNKIKKIIADFINKKGIYALSSIPYKLGIMMHGDPGCGKTSFIKALANETNRCIIQIFLDKFKNVQSFKELFQSDYIYVKDRNCYGTWMYIPMNKRIIVFEEIDTAGTIVMDRMKLKEMIRNRDSHSSFDRQIFGNIFSKYEKYKNGADSDSEDDPMAGVTGATGLGNTMKIIKRKMKPLKNVNISGNPSQIGCSEEFNDDIFDKAMKHNSGITLGDILDTLDGLCESTGLIYVITTNHVDFLDPALIRPGRISYSAKLSNMEYTEIKEMLIYYYITHNSHSEDIENELKMGLIEEIAKYFNKKYKPSKLEELCKNYSLCELFENLKNI